MQAMNKAAVDKETFYLKFQALDEEDVLVKNVAI